MKTLYEKDEEAELSDGSSDELPDFDDTGYLEVV